MVGGGSQIVIIRWENLSRLRREDLRLWLFGRKTSPDGGGRILDGHYSVGGSLLIAA
jgi:hypothetical protein